MATAGEMLPWQTASGVYFVYVAVVAAILPGLPLAKRRLAFFAAAVGLLGTVAARMLANAVLNDWVIPPTLLLFGYWTSGLLFFAPMPRAERVLLTLDRYLGVTRAARMAPRPLAEYLELAYAAVYPAIPIALVIRLIVMNEADASSFWTTILVTDYICFAVLPWVQTRPPRALEAEAPWNARFRAFNLRLLGRTSIHVNTFPSGHAAEALAAALLVIGAPPVVTLSMFVLALSISIGTVLGRYHYAADAIAGWAVALLVWAAVV